jgi:benzylsuccinate CoA-transferase BbsE subunit
MTTPIKELQILDLSDQKASFCSKLLADFGARVIKVEKPGGCASRHIGPFVPSAFHPEASLSFHYNNTNKQSITLDLTHPRAKDLLIRLVKQADVLVESFSPGYLDELGLGYSALSKISHRLIMASVTGFGQQGPRKNYHAGDLVAAAYGGQLYISGEPSRSPLKIHGTQSYITASLYGALGILLALRKRNLTGVGEHIDISLQEAVLSTLEPISIQYFQNAFIPRRQGRLHWNRVFHIFPCKDGYIQLTLFQQWETMIEWMDSEGMADDLSDARWLDGEYRRNHLDHVIEVIGRWTRSYPADELSEKGQLMGFPWASVQSPQQIKACPQHKARDFFIDIKHPKMPGAIKTPRFPSKFSNQVPRAGRSPLVGEHNRQIYQNELGLSEGELMALKDRGVI